MISENRKTNSLDSVLEWTIACCRFLNAHKDVSYVIVFAKMCINDTTCLLGEISSIHTCSCWECFLSNFLCYKHDIYSGSHSYHFWYVTNYVKKLRRRDKVYDEPLFCVECRIAFSPPWQTLQIRFVQVRCYSV